MAQQRVTACPAHGHCHNELDPRAAVWCSTGRYENQPHPLIATHGKCWSSWVKPTFCKHESRPR